MKIATWNIERLRKKDNLPLIIEKCESLNADILVLTETDSRVNPKHKNCFSTVEPDDKYNYKPTETRVSIFTKYDCVKHYETFNDQTAVCVELKTDHGNLIGYGTIIGVLGNRCKSFMEDLNKQMILIVMQKRVVFALLVILTVASQTSIIIQKMEDINLKKH